MSLNVAFLFSFLSFLRHFALIFSHRLAAHKAIDEGELKGTTVVALPRIEIVGTLDGWRHDGSLADAIAPLERRNRQETETETVVEKSLVDGDIEQIIFVVD